jgi:hypothetical protein
MELKLLSPLLFSQQLQSLGLLHELLSFHGLRVYFTSDDCLTQAAVDGTTCDKFDRT